MQDVPQVGETPIAIEFLATYVIVMGVSNQSGSIKMETHSKAKGYLIAKIIADVKLAYGPIHHG